MCYANASGLCRGLDGFLQRACLLVFWVGGSYRFSKGSVNPSVQVLRASGFQFLGFKLRTSVSSGGLKDGRYKRFSVVRISDRDLKV